MFAQMRSALGIEKGVDILEHIEAQPAEDRHRCEEAIRDVEREAMVPFSPLELSAGPSTYPSTEILLGPYESTAWSSRAHGVS